MLVAVDTFLLKIDNAINSKLNIKGLGGRNIIIDTDYNKYDHSCRIAEVFACPIEITSQYYNDTKIYKGDTVVIHHFVAQPNNKMNIEGGNIYKSEYFHLFAKIEDEKIIPIEDIIFVEPILEPEENMFSGSIQIKPQRENLKQQGKIFALSKKARELGLQEGDHVFFTLNADYSMKIVGNDLWRMRLRNILFIIRDGQMVCPKGRMIVKQYKEQPNKELLFDKTTLQLEGKICAVAEDVLYFKEGMKVNFYTSLGGAIEFKGDKYCFVEPRHISYIKE